MSASTSLILSPGQPRSRPPQTVAVAVRVEAVHQAAIPSEVAAGVVVEEEVVMGS